MYKRQDAQGDVIDKIALAGSNEARINSEISALDKQLVNQEVALSRIEDLDMALAAGRFAKTQLKMQVATTMMAQANMLFTQRNYVEDLL